MSLRTKCSPTVVGFLILALAVSALHGAVASSPAFAMDCCPVGGSSSGHQGHGSTASAQDAHAAAFPPKAASEAPVTARVVGMDKSRQIVSLRLELPLSREALASLKSGDVVSLSFKLDKDGRPVAIGVIPAGGSLTLKLTGIQCQACADRVESALKAAPGVTQVSVTADPPRAMVSYDPARTTPEAIEEVVRRTPPIHAGYPFGASH